MPKPLQWIIEHQHELAKKFEDFEPKPVDFEDEHQES